MLPGFSHLLTSEEKLVEMCSAAMEVIKDEDEETLLRKCKGGLIRNKDFITDGESLKKFVRMSLLIYKMFSGINLEELFSGVANNLW